MQAEVLKKKTDEVMTEFLINIKEQELNWKKNLINQENKNIKISDNKNQIKISSDKEFKKNNNDDKS